MAGDVYNLERELSWNAHRAVAAAVKDAPAIPLSEDLMVEVEIRIYSDSWPGKTETGRSKSRLLGSASCAYRAWREEDEERSADG